MKKRSLLFLPPREEQTYQVFSTEVLTEIERLTEATVNPHARQYTAQELSDLIGSYEICITGWRTPPLTAAIAERAKHLKLVLHAAGTVRPYLDRSIFDRGVIVANGNAAIARVTAEATLALMLSVNWCVTEWALRMRAGGWKERTTLVPGVQGRTIGIIGYGTITRLLLPMLRSLADTEIVVFSRHLSQEEAHEAGVKRASLEQLLERSDIISLHASLTDRTRHILNRNNLARIKDGALLVNLARGELIEEEALVEELKKNRFRAALDVYAREPLEEESALRELPNVTLLPHLGAATPWGRRSIGETILTNLKDYLEGGTPRDRVSPSALRDMSLH